MIFNHVVSSSLPLKYTQSLSSYTIPYSFLDMNLLFQFSRHLLVSTLFFPHSISFSDSSLVHLRLTRHQSMFWRNLFPLRPRGFYAVTHSPLYLLLKLRSALEEFPNEFTLCSSQILFLRFLCA